jgi:hypothetical protein
MLRSDTTISRNARSLLPGRSGAYPDGTHTRKSDTAFRTHHLANSTRQPGTVAGTEPLVLAARASATTRGRSSRT